MNIIPSVTRSVVIGLGLILASTGAQAKVYRCIVNGNTTYSDRPCEGTDSETVNMVAPSAAKAGTAVAKPTPVVESSADKPAVTAKPIVAAKFLAPSPVEIPAAAAAGRDWHLAGEYSDRVHESSRTLKRASYGIECNATRRRPFVYAINGRYSLTAPSRSGDNQLQGPFYDSLDAAATAACTVK